MSVLLTIICDSCGEVKHAHIGERAHHQIRRRLRSAGWRQARRNGAIAHEGPLDFCPLCVDELKTPTTAATAAKG